MYNNYDYPTGSDTVNAPWNQVEHKAFTYTTCTQTLSKDVPIYMYDLTEDERLDQDYSNVDWSKQYYGNGYHTPLQLIALFKNYLLEGPKGLLTKHPKFIEYLIKECEDWIEDETAFTEA